MNKTTNAKNENQNRNNRLSRKQMAIETFKSTSLSNKACIIVLIIRSKQQPTSNVR